MKNYFLIQLLNEIGEEISSTEGTRGFPNMIEFLCHDLGLF